MFDINLKKLLILVLFFVFFTKVFGQISGIHTINPLIPVNYNSAPYNFHSISDALNHPQLGSNIIGVASSGVSYKIESGVILNESNLIIKKGGSHSGWLRFIGDSANLPTIRTGSGINSNDAAFIVHGADFLSFEHIKIEESQSNLNDNITPLDYGFLFLRISLTPDASQNIIIKSCNINFYKNGYGIGIAFKNLNENFDYTEAKSTAGISENLYFENVKINGGQFGYYFEGASEKAYYDNSISILGGMVLNFGANFNFTSGIYAKGFNDLKIDSLIINNKNGLKHKGRIAAIWIDQALEAKINIINNLISLHAETDSLAFGIYNIGASSFSTNHTNNYVKIINNKIVDFDFIGDSQPMSLIFSGSNEFLKGPDLTEINANQLSGNSLKKVSGNLELIKTNSGIFTDEIWVTNNVLTSNSIVIDSFGNGRAIFNDLSSEAGIYKAIYNLIDSFEVFSKNGSLGGIINNGNIMDSSIINHNSISNISLNTNGFGFTHLISVNCKSTVNFLILHNKINHAYSGKGYMIGINAPNNKNGEISFNNINNLQSEGSEMTHLSGIEIQNSAINKDIVSNNLIEGLLSNGQNIFGINCATERAYIFSNEIFNIINNNYYSITTGIHLNNSSAQYLFNNFISDLKAPYSNAEKAVIGINAGHATKGSGTRALFHNSIYLNASSNQSNFGSTAIDIDFPCSLILGNNNFVNVSTPGSNGKTIVLSLSGSDLTLGYFSGISDNNNLYSGLPSNQNLIFYNSITNVSFNNISDYKSHANNVDQNSVSFAKSFLNDSIAPYDLHLNLSINNPLVDAGKNFSSFFQIADDIDGDVRNNGFSDLGADEAFNRPLSNSIKVSNSNQLLLIPNPAKSYVKTLLSDDDALISKINVYDLMGNVLLSFDSISENSFEFNIPQNFNGLYLVVVVSNEGKVFSSRLLVK